MVNKSGKIICVTSVKGGVGKTTTLLNLAGIYSLEKYRVLILDLDLFAGAIAVNLDIRNKKDIFMLIDSISNNRFTTLSDYVSVYNKNIDVIASPKDPRQALKIDGKYLPVVFDIAKREYDVILVDTNHVLDEVNLTILDYSYMSLFIISNDIADLKNMKSIVSIFKDADKTNYLICLNNSKDNSKVYMSLFDIKNVIKKNVSYVIDKSFYIKNIDKFVLNGEILTLNKSINRFHSSDINNLKKLALDLIDDKHSKEVDHE